MTCRYCLERIEDEAPVIEQLDGRNVCEECARWERARWERARWERVEDAEPAEVCE